MMLDVFFSTVAGLARRGLSSTDVLFLCSLYGLALSLQSSVNQSLTCSLWSSTIPLNSRDLAFVSMSCICIADV